MVARQAAEEATTWVVEDGTYEATVSKYEKVPDDKLFDSEHNAGVQAYNVDFNAMMCLARLARCRTFTSRRGGAE